MIVATADLRCFESPATSRQKEVVIVGILLIIQYIFRSTRIMYDNIYPCMRFIPSNTCYWRCGNWGLCRILFASIPLTDSVSRGIRVDVAALTALTTFG